MAGVSPLLALVTGGLKGYSAGMGARRQAQADREKREEEASLKREQLASQDEYRDAMAANGASRALTGEERARTDRLYRLGLDADGNPIPGLDGGILGATNRRLQAVQDKNFNETLFKTTKGVGDGTFDPDSASTILRLMHGGNPSANAPAPVAAPLPGDGLGPLTPPPGDPLGRTLPASALLGGAPVAAPAPVNPLAGLGVGPLARKRIEKLDVDAQLVDTRRQYIEGPQAEHTDALTKKVMMDAATMPPLRKAMTGYYATNTSLAPQKLALDKKQKDRDFLLGQRRLQLQAQGLSAQQAKMQADNEYRGRMADVAEKAQRTRSWQAHNPPAGTKGKTGATLLPNGLTQAEDDKLAGRYNGNRATLTKLVDQYNTARSGKGKLSLNTQAEINRQIRALNADNADIERRRSRRPPAPHPTPRPAVPAAHHIHSQPRNKRGQVTGPPRPQTAPHGPRRTKSGITYQVVP